ncbi:DUF7946 domain-containing protein [Gluconacetobacter takamatsuzukensis]|uniref:Uncharacterized protein n=1 Tax=Gluconacetobacter takamatsuzukensis TaxID=1286190 RepID=A0A7W4KFB9_9PROT|nr:hypothetical protein [Gluconacetobacter takamatsuzukensis]MBB2205917.1 hypothetical protein [Gluconacetobacter takamatsuzukensis]
MTKHPDLEFVFKYNPEKKSHLLNAYDAATALYGISRSISIITHYAINGTIIKQAPAIRNAEVFVQPPNAGSFEFIVPIVQLAPDPSTKLGTIIYGVGASYIYDLTKLIFARLSGKSEKSSSETIQNLQRTKSNEIDAVSDSIEEDIVRIQRPIINNVCNINIYGGGDNIINLDIGTYEYSRTKIISSTVEQFFGHVTSFNSSSGKGRFWVENENRTIGFSVHKEREALSKHEKGYLSSSLDAWVRSLQGELILVGFPLRSKQGLLKHIFVTQINKIG